jgi:hypothetical protein
VCQLKGGGGVRYGGAWRERRAGPGAWSGAMAAGGR